MVDCTSASLVLPTTVEDGSLPSVSISSRRTSRRTSRRVTPLSSSSGPQSGDDVEWNDMTLKGVGEERMSDFDPTRFTPNLHANLVSEILSLRREIEGKSSTILDLEESLHGVNEENSRMKDALNEDSQRSKVLERQVRLLEGGSLSAFTELTTERDGANENLLESRKRLEASQKKARNLDEALDRANALWEKDREHWDDERRNLERKVHVVEGRLKTVLAEIEAAQLNGQGRPGSAHGPEDGPHSRSGSRSYSRASGIRSAQSHYRGGSIDSLTSIYRLSHVVDIKRPSVNGLSLADELQQDVDEETDTEDTEGGDVLPDALGEDPSYAVRPFSVQSFHSDAKARKLLGLAPGEDGNVAIYDRSTNEVLPDDNVRGDGPPVYSAYPRHAYTDTATQYSPPPSPRLTPSQHLETIDEAENERSSLYSDTDPAREGADVPSSGTSQDGVHRTPSMASRACQTMELPLSPRAGPTAECHETTSAEVRPEMITASTQTQEGEELPGLASADTRDAAVSAPEVPLIAIHRPASTYSARDSVVLPPHTKSVSCQANIAPSLTSTAVQTEEIRIDQRPVKLPPHLLPSSISSQPSSPASEVPQARKLQLGEGLVLGYSLTAPPQLHKPEPIQPTKMSDLFGDYNFDAFPDSFRVSRRSYSVGAQTSTVLPVEAPPMQAIDEFDLANLTDDSSASREPIRKTLSKVDDSWRLVPQTTDAIGDRLQSQKKSVSPKKTSQVIHSRSHQRPRQEVDVPGNHWSEARTSPGTKLAGNRAQGNLQQLALSIKGDSARIRRNRSPSAPNLSPPKGKQMQAPPFPVPDRHSSRKLPLYGSDGTGSPTSSSFPGKHAGKPDRRRSAMRKMRSISDYHSEDDLDSRCLSPTLTEPSSFGGTDIQSPKPHQPLPEDGIPQPSRRAARRVEGHGSQPSTSSAGGSTTSEQPSVVDAIAQTMIGEWMWKYVRRRKSFGLPESAVTEFENESKGGEGGSGVRHQRWVWLTPYDRAIMWSNKQPTSGTALMGKSGRKLTIQSVMDVRDEAPMPKGATSAACFGRSILILTPQRALKFTASSRERHYIWLSALSFLSHSSVAPSHLAPGAYRPPAVQKQVTLPRSPVSPKPTLADRRAHSFPYQLGKQESPPSSQPLEAGSDCEDEDAAEPPLVPLYAKNSRKRSIPGPKLLPPGGSLRSFASTTNYNNINNNNNNNNKTSIHSTQGSDGWSYASGWLTDGGARPPSQRDSAAFALGQRTGRESRAGERIATDRSGSAHANAPMQAEGNFFDAIGTRRMEAFVKGMSGLADGSGRVEAERPRRGSRPKPVGYRDLRYWGLSEERLVETTLTEDPFEGF